MEEAKTSNAAEPMIPKRRFDEINLQMKNAKQRVTELESLNAKLLLLQKQAEQLKEKHEKADQKRQTEQPAAAGAASGEGQSQLLLFHWKSPPSIR